VAERFADSQADKNQLAAAFAESDAIADLLAGRVSFDHSEWHAAIIAKCANDSNAFSAAFRSVVNMPCYVDSKLAWGGLLGRIVGRCWNVGKWIVEDLRNEEYAPERMQTNLVREIFGNPFRRVDFLPEWRTDTALTLVRQMYESREFGAMPILADALQDAGCDSDELLNHCRDTNATHVRGCWALDLVLGKT